MNRRACSQLGGVQQTLRQAHQQIPTNPANLAGAFAPPLSYASAGELPMNATRRRPKRAALYLRVSTSEQTTRNQRRELKAVADRHGWEVVNVFEDAGFSGGKGREARPGLDELLKAVARREID